MLAPYAAGADPAEFARIRDVAVVLLRYVALFAFFDAMVVVFSCAIRGAGDTRFPLICTLFTNWGVMLAPVAIADALGRNTLTFSWIMCTSAIMISGHVLLIRFLRGRWKTMRVIESAPRDGDAVAS